MHDYTITKRYKGLLVQWLGRKTVKSENPQDNPFLSLFHFSKQGSHKDCFLTN